MRLTAAIKFQLSEVKKSLIIFYAIIYAIFAVLTISFMLLQKNSSVGTGTIGGMDSASLIFIFVMGLNTFKTPFRFFLQNGISRKTTFASFAVTLLPVALVMAIIDTVNGLIFSGIIHYESFFRQMYFNLLGGTASPASMVVQGLLWSFFAYALMGMIGYFIASLYYRMNKAWKLCVSIGVPVLSFVIIPMVDFNYFDGFITRKVGSFISAFWGFTNGNHPYTAMLSCTLAFIALGGLSYLLIRKASLKEQG